LGCVRGKIVRHTLGRRVEGLAPTGESKGARATAGKVSALLVPRAGTIFRLR